MFSVGSRTAMQFKGVTARGCLQGGDCKGVTARRCLQGMLTTLKFVDVFVCFGFVVYASSPFVPVGTCAVSMTSHMRHIFTRNPSSLM